MSMHPLSSQISGKYDNVPEAVSQSNPIFLCSTAEDAEDENRTQVPSRFTSKV